MRKLWFILKKEFLLLFRDIPGLVILIIMPILLIFVVTLAQDKALKNQTSLTQVLFINEAFTPFSARLLANLDSSGFFHAVPEINQVKLTRFQAKALISNGDFQFGIIIQPHDSAIILLIDPTLQPGYKNSISNSLTFIIKNTQAKEVMNGILKNLAGDLESVVEGLVSQSFKKLPPVKETYAVKDRSTIQPNVIQNNVPGFILFAMFFIVIPLAGSLITEKNEGSFQRLRSLPVRFSAILGGKVLAYLFVCLFQFILMMVIGTLIFPALFGLPGLEPGHQYFAIFIATVASSLAAVGFGIIVGAAATSHNQAALFGSVMVVLLGVISGTFFPVHLMPGYIQAISHLSPIRWGIDNYLNLFIREGNLVSILPGTGLLLLFFGFAMITSIAIFAKPK